MTDPEVVVDDVDIDSEEEEEEGARRTRRSWGLLAVILLLLLLMFCVLVSVETWVTGGPEQARFIARNVECLACHTELIPEFSRPAVHNPFAKKDCQTCHTPHGKKVSVTMARGAGEQFRQYQTVLQWLPLRWFWLLLDKGDAARVGMAPAGAGEADGPVTQTIKGSESELTMKETELCWMCHGDLGEKLSDPYQHQPFSAGRCSSCHDPHASNHGALLAQEINQICFTCHPMGGELNRMQAHPPAEQGWCVDCHDPHASKFKGMIVAAQRDLCFGCHPSVANKGDMPVQHVPFLNNECTSCHEPHGSDARPLLVEMQPRLCYNCHPTISDQFAQASHHPIGLNLTCSSCHDPHAAQFDALVDARDNAFCYQCHGEIRVTYDTSSHTREVCIRCHTPHGSPFRPILRDSNPDLCLQCHEPNSFDQSNRYVYRNNHPVRPQHYDANSERALTCTTSCHNPHGTRLNFMLRYFAFADDGGCLMCHAVTPGKRVGIDY